MVVLKEIYYVLCVKEKMFKPGVTGRLWYLICILNQKPSNILVQKTPWVEINQVHKNSIKRWL